MIQWRYEPAHDLGLTGQQRLCSCRRETQLGQIIVRLAWGFSVRSSLKLWNHLEVHGAARLPANPPFVLAANHASHLDALVLASALPLEWRDRIFPIAAGDYFFASAVRTWLAVTVLNALPVWRQRKLGHAHELAELRQRLLQDQCIYIIFPEGSRTRDGQIHCFKPGFGRLIAGTSVPVLPCYLRGTGAALGPHHTAVHPAAVTLEIGSPLRFPEVADDLRGWKQIAAITQAGVETLQRDCQPTSDNSVHLLKPPGTPPSILWRARA